MKKLWLIGAVLLTGCATYGGYQPTVDDSVYNQHGQNRVQQPPQYQQPQECQPLYQRQPVLNKKGRQVYDQYDRPVYQNVPVVDQYGRPVCQQPEPQVQQYQGPQNSAQHDSIECQQLARNAASTGTEAVKGGVAGAALGAATGAIIGAFTGSAGTGAALGAATGAVGGGAYSGISADEQYKRAYSNCMRNRGHNVID